MSCDDFEEDLVDLARGEELGEAERGEALAHAERCLRCAARMEDERAVTFALRAFAARTAGAEAPPRVGSALLRGFRDPETLEADGPAIASPSRAVALLLLAAAAAILAAIVVVPPRGGRFNEPSPATRLPGSPASSSVAVPGRSGDSDFVALSYGEDLRELDSLQVVSIELPPTVLAALGWPAADSVETGLVKAEVIVGHDGVARAIRFVD
jgi:anti-sigma factor RsiW